MRPFSFAVIGGGIVGLATARALSANHPGATIIVLEKEDRPGRHQSTHNSGVLHAGLYYKPGSLKARMAVEGIRQMTAYCSEKGIAHEICGKVVVATTEEEVVRLRTLLDRGQANGLQGLAWMTAGQLREREPHAAGLAAVLVPEEGIVDYDAVCMALLADLTAAGVQFQPRARVEHLKTTSDGWVIETSSGAYEAGYLVNCAGLFCDRIAQLAGVPREVRIVPFRGEYYQLAPEARHLVRHLIYPVPDPTFPFLGVHFTRLVHGGIEAGPNAVLAAAREGYKKTDFHAAELMDALSFPGLWNFVKHHPRMCWEEIVRSFSRRLFADSLRKLVPEIAEKHLAPGGAGVRAQAMLKDGTLVQDFWLKSQHRALHVLNAPSPAATASLAIGEELARQIASGS